MLDMKFVRDNPEKVIEAVKKRNGTLNLDEFLALDKERQEIGKLKKAGQDTAAKQAEVREMGAKINADDEKLRSVEARLKEIILTIPNMPADDVPVGKSDKDNPVVRTWGEPTKFDFKPQAHWDRSE